MNEFDDQTLGAFVDGELDTQTCESIIIEMDKNSEIRDRVYKLRRAKDLMQIGYSDITAKNKTHNKIIVWKRYSAAIAVSITILVISLGSGFSGFYFGSQKHISENQLDSGLQTHKAERILLHISESNLQQFNTAIDYAEKFLIEHKDSEDQIALIANAGGLDLMRSGISPLEDKITNFIKKYDNIHFIACANSVKRLQKKGIRLELIDDIRLNKPAMDHIIEYIQDGWTYKKVSSITQL